MTDYNTKSNKWINREVEKMLTPLSDGTCTPNFTENPSDAWPVILDTKKELAKQKIHWYLRENPLRAAMIVYLMMEGE